MRRRQLPRLLPTLLRAAQTGASDLYAASAAEFLAVHLVNQHRSASPGIHRAVEDPRIRRVQELLRAGIEQQITLEDLAEEVRLSRWHLLRLFRSVTGETPNQYLTRHRMQRARILLRRHRTP